ncbi:hypothetical protein [Vagococcus fluvialis]|uniref:hypothetical protein n=1 Tax=Vagococcus fluvialis TaxID=2738 RepID=UPI001A8DB109|nr:hypothetical protein [Vagococcus fluvialis]MBO0443706.1 hypothetical protein [Vagococcus fluvialis]
MCPECYSEKSRVTPIYHPYDCLSRHTQYICGTCRRCICIQKDKTRNLYRWNFPFKSLQDAKYYLRTAEYTLKDSCGIYEIKLDKSRNFYKIFQKKSDVTAYLKKNKGKKCNKIPVFKTEAYQEFPNTEVRKLTEEEISYYLLER